MVSSLLLAGMALLSACGSGGSDAPGNSGNSGTGEGVGAGEAATEQDAGTDGSPLLRGDTVLVFMDEYFIELPDTVPAGSLHFRVRNAGFEEHNFEILRNDSLLWAFDDPLNPAQSGVLDVTLEPGEYDILCTVSGHEGRGMQEVLTVTGNES